MKKAIVIGATSGIGRETALQLLAEGWQLGLAGRSERELAELQTTSPDRIAIQVLDVTQEDAVDSLRTLIEKTGGMDLFLLASGIGKQNPDLAWEIDENTVMTNALGFTRMVNAAFNYFKTQGSGQLAVISSIAGTRGLGVAASYSATKRYQNHYVSALCQLSRIEGYNIVFTDIQPGFVDTALLNDTHHYPFKMKPERVARLIVKALKRRRRIVVIDWKYRLLVWVWRLVPRGVWERLPIRN